MSATVKQFRPSDAAAQDLWRVAETDDVDELLRILPRLGDVNARNKHGMTALMRAAFNGHERMVRTLLEHGADPNLTRNDKFTALALAAFFGHTETVRTLIEHGAKTEVVTRCGTSAYMWATARTFEEAARCLESHAPPTPPTPRAGPVRVAAPASVPVPAPVAAPVPAPAAASAPVSTASVVKRLKDPPEIWDLVHEVPRGFDVRSAFLSRLRSMNRTAAVFALTGLLLLVAGGVGVILFRGTPASGVHPEAVSTQTPTDNVSAPPKVEDKEIAREPSAVTSEVEVPPDAVSNHPRNALPRQSRPRPTANAIVMENSPPQEEPAAKPSVAAAVPQTEKPKPPDSAAQNKPANKLSPHLIAPAKSATPKAKVIQWP